jgi:D-lactate dehydrogenase
LKIAFFDTKPYDVAAFAPLAERFGYGIKFFDNRLNADTAPMAAGYDAVCAFVGDTLDEPALKRLEEAQVKLIALRSAGYNNVDLKAAWGRIKVVRVPAYSPAAVAEHAAALLLCLNRKIHRAYIRTRDNNFSINGLMGFDLRGKTAGVVGTGRIGQLFIEICRGFGMEVLAYDPHPIPGADIRYVSLDELCAQADVLSLHCPLTPDTHHLIGRERLARVKPGLILLNTSRGGLIDTDALIEALKEDRVGGAGLDVYEEEEAYFFEDHSDRFVADDDLARLLSFPNVLITSHQGFFTREAMRAITDTTMENIRAFAQGEPLQNEICWQCANG